jgi:hypothetical protein
MQLRRRRPSRSYSPWILPDRSWQPDCPSVHILFAVSLNHPWLTGHGRINHCQTHHVSRTDGQGRSRSFFAFDAPPFRYLNQCSCAGGDHHEATPHRQVLFRRVSSRTSSDHNGATLPLLSHVADRQFGNGLVRSLRSTLPRFDISINAVAPAATITKLLPMDDQTRLDSTIHRQVLFRRVSSRTSSDHNGATLPLLCSCAGGDHHEATPHGYCRTAHGSRTARQFCSHGEQN